jgi:hypothetical protein
MEQKGQRSKQHTERRILVRFYATGLWPRFATVVRGSSRRITTMKASASSILEYQSDQPSMKQLQPLSLLHQPDSSMPKKTSPPSLFSCGVVPYQKRGLGADLGVAELSEDIGVYVSRARKAASESEAPRE